MTLDEALKLLGTTRVIWIDDHFNDSAALLADMLTQKIETTRQCEFPELKRPVAGFDFDPDGSIAEIRQILADIGDVRRNEIKQRFLHLQQAIDQDPGKELTSNAIGRACQMLNVDVSDRWPFDGIEEKLRAVCASGDESVSYMIDLKESAGGADDTRGLEIVVALHELGSKGTAFIMTHEATEATEADTEKHLMTKLSARNAEAIALCVVSKHRIAGDETENEAVEEALRVAIKRAGLRRSVNEVLVKARAEVSVSFNQAAASLLRVPPEQLDRHVVDLAYREGVSELHVIERALSGFISQQIRKMFGTDEEVLRTSERLRDLREIPLKPVAGDANIELAAFSKAEVWESEELINAALAPVACGDVFEVDTSEPTLKSTKARRFVLLGQPCDIAMRPGGKRDGTVATLVEVTAKNTPSEGKEKEYTLPVMIDGQFLVVNFRSSATVLLSTLDLASFRKDGLVSVMEDQERPNGLLPGLKSIYEQRTAPYLALIAAGNAAVTAAAESKAAQEAAAKAAKENGQASPVDTPLQPPKIESPSIQQELLLTFAAPDAFKNVMVGVYQEAVRLLENKKVVLDRPSRITWRLRRVGRIRPPYADAVLDRMVGVINRRAFEVDFMKPVASAAVASAPEPSQAEAINTTA